MTTGVGIHCFAGGFTMGVTRILPVVGQLEIHDFGRETCDAHGTKFMNAPTWEDWDQYRDDWHGAEFCFGNPRCTAFSGYSAGFGPDVRGATAKPTQDIWDLCEFGVHAKLDLIAFESVQQCATVGKALLDRLRDEVFAPRHYRIAHLFVNTAAEDCPQYRKRYFFVAYRDDRPFNVYRPNLELYATTVGDVLSKPIYANAAPHPDKIHRRTNVSYDHDSHMSLCDDDRAVLKFLGEGQSFNSLGEVDPEELLNASKKHYNTWRLRTSHLPFSLHCPVRLKWSGYCPTITSASGVLIHPKQDRPLTVGEIAAMMCWPEGFIPRGADPVAQIGKGVVPNTGEWLARQIKAYFNHDWGNDDFEASYCKATRNWHGTNYAGSSKPLEKWFRMTQYVPPLLFPEHNS